MHIEYAIPYILFTIFLILFAVDGNVFVKNNNFYKSLRSFSLTTVAILSIFFIGCRGFVEADWYYYFPYFERTPSLFDGEEKIRYFFKTNAWENGYAIFNIICKTFTSSYFGFQFICFSIDFLVLHFFFKKYCGKYYFLGWVLFWIFQGFVFEIIILRNTKSIMLFLISIKYAHQKKVIKYMLLNLLGLMFHSSAALYLPLYFFFQLKRIKKLELALFCIGVFIYILQIPIVKPILKIVAKTLPGRYSWMASAYLDSKQFSSAYGITFGFIERFFSFILIFKFSDKIIKDDERMKIFWFLFLLYQFSYLYFSDMSILVGRIPNLFICSYWVFYSKVFGNLRKEWKYVFFILIVLYGCVRNLSLLSHSTSYYDNFITGAMSDSERKSLYRQNGYDMEVTF